MDIAIAVLARKVFPGIKTSTRRLVLSTQVASYKMP
jgi:hypothetical protein